MREEKEPLGFLGPFERHCPLSYFSLAQGQAFFGCCKYEPVHVTSEAQEPAASGPGGRKARQQSPKFLLLFLMQWIHSLACRFAKVISGAFLIVPEYRSRTWLAFASRQGGEGYEHIRDAQLGCSFWLQSCLPAPVPFSGSSSVCLFALC